MQRLTVREAAEALGKSEAAVRKRIQRGTLAHRRSPDGHVYVYVDNNSGAQQETGVEKISSPNQDSRSTWWDLASRASALVAVTGALIYVLGLFALWAPIAKGTTHDVVTAWTATALVPRAVVVGLGLKQLVAFPLLAATLIFAITFYTRKLGTYGLTYSLAVPVVVYCMWRIATAAGPLSQAPIFLLAAFVVQLFVGIIYVCMVVGELIAGLYRRAVRHALLVSGLWVTAYLNWSVWSGNSEGPSFTISSTINAAIVIGAGAIVFMGAAWGAAQLEESSHSDNSSWGWLRAFLIVMSAAFLAAFMLTVPGRPPLPGVKIDVKEKDENVVDGSLLTHTDGFWYVFQQQKGKPEDRLTAIPDDEVKRVWVLSRGEE